MAESDSESSLRPRQEFAFRRGFFWLSGSLLPESVFEGTLGCGGEEVLVLWLWEDVVPAGSMV